MKKDKPHSGLLKLFNKKANKKKSKEKINYKWIFTIVILAFSISILFSFVSEIALSNANLIVGLLILILFIIIGIIFDMIGVAVTTADEAPFHSMGAQKINGARMAILLKKNADRVSSFCNDVVGDICGIISGSAGVAITASIVKATDTNTFIVGLVVTGVVASLTIGGKALCKSFAINNSDAILYKFAKVLSLFKK